MPRPKVTRILSSVIEMIMAAARDSHPREFACVLRGEGDVISEIVLVPGTVSSDRSALLKMHMMPIDFSVVGTAHSHPSPNRTPSRADIGFFSNFGPVHIIASYPYTMDSWSAYDRNGSPIELDMV